MADYTPDVPRILGNEWVPIKDQLYPIDPSQEIGHSFHLTAQTTAVDGRCYVAADQGRDISGVRIDETAMAIYPRSTEGMTGPLKQVIVPCNGGVVQGDFNLSGTASDVADALRNIGDDKYCYFQGTLGEIDLKFAFLDYPELDGKRIVRMEFLTYIQANDSFLTPGTDVSMEMFQKFDSEAYLSGPSFIISEEGVIKSGINAAIGPTATTLDSYDGIWGAPADYPTGSTANVFPWTYSRLSRYDDSYVGANPSSFYFFVSESIPDIAEFLYVNYAALRITYCEEQRIAVGATRGWTTNGQGAYAKNSVSQTNIIPLKTIDLNTDGIMMAAGDYTVTVTGQRNGAQLYAIRELYPMEAQPGKVINYTYKVGSQFEVLATPQMVQLSLHTDTDSISEVHGYGRQLQPATWGDSANPVRQGIINASGASSVDYPYARFYARRSTGTTQPLTLRNVATPTITSSITVTEFDALEEITDGWKEVTLTFTAPLPSFSNAGTAATYEWVTNETNPGDQWQILAASAIVYDPDTGDPITGLNDLANTTYGSTTAFLTEDGVADDTSDATLLFAQEMPAVSGLAVQVSSLAIEGIGSECDLMYASCIPTGISYHSVTWTPLSASSMPATGFGYYELQRSDAETDWQTILYATSPLVTGYSDYEARVGIASDYRIRFQHRLLFPSAWSSTVTSTIPAPGVTGTQVSHGVLIFTTNNVQDGSRSLAYAMQWDSDVVEDFTFIEAGDVKLQQMYGRDFQVAFRPLERGGERFQRTLLIQAAAVPSGLIQDGFTSLRDLAWEDVPYICVRDELGDRWLATVIVPDGNVRRKRRLYMANIDVIEVTDTASTVVLPADGDTCIPALWDGLPGWDYGCWSE